MLSSPKALWEKKKFWIILIGLQILLNFVGVYLAEGLQNSMMISSGCVLLALNLYAIISQRKNILLLLLNIVLLYFNYSLVAAVFWNAGSLDEIFSPYSVAEHLSAINIILLFFGTYVILLKKNTAFVRKAFLPKGKPCYLVVVACAVYIALAPFLFYETETFGTRGTITALYEYALVVMIVGLRFSRRDVKAVGMLLLASVWIITHGLLHGERVLALQMMIVWGLYLLMHVLSFKIIIPACIAGILLFTIFGMFRGANALEGNVIVIAADYLLHGGLVNDTSYYAYWAGLSIMRFADIAPFWERLLGLVRYLLYIVFGSVIPDANLSTLAMRHNFHAGGGWLPFHFNFWLGYPGVILAGAGISWLLNKISSLTYKKYFWNYLALYVVATCPRWYLYSPSALLRGVLIFSVFYALCLAARAGAPYILPWLKNHVPVIGERLKTHVPVIGERLKTHVPVIREWLKNHLLLVWNWLKKQEMR